MIAVDQSKARRGRRGIGSDDNAKVAGWRYGTASCAVAARHSSRRQAAHHRVALEAELAAIISPDRGEPPTANRHHRDDCQQGIEA
ncbi:MAG TPA: hypothetical protein VJZ74_05590 [Pseudolabrys sp.]|nr:hypothetical protein [Pseudolabrys sp.]